MMKIKMTVNDKKNERFAGLIYRVADEVALRYFENEMAIPVVEKKKAVKHGDWKNEP